MTYFVVDPKQQKADAEERLRVALQLLDAAVKVYTGDDSRTNRISVYAAKRLVCECKAELAEWTR